jgi:hypothetical protein
VDFRDIGCDDGSMETYLKIVPNGGESFGFLFVCSLFNDAFSVYQTI